MLTRFAKWLPVGFVAAGFALLGSPREAHAVLVLTGTIAAPSGTVRIFASDGNDAVLNAQAALAGATILLDQDPGIANQLTLAPGTLAPGYTVQSSSTFTTKGAGGNNSNDIDSTALQIRNNTGGDVTTNIVISDNNFVGPSTSAHGSGGGTFANAAGSSYSIAFYNDPSNAQLTFPPGTPPGNLIASHDFTGAEAPADNTVAFNFGPVPVTDGSLFGMALQFQFKLVNGATFTSRGQNEFKNTAVVPEPATFAMALGGLPILGVYWLRRRKAA